MFRRVNRDILCGKRIGDYAVKTSQQSTNFSSRPSPRMLCYLGQNVLLDSYS